MQFPLYVDHEQLEASVLYLAAIDDAGLIVVAAFATGFAHRPSPVACRGVEGGAPRTAHARGRDRTPGGDHRRLGIRRTDATVGVVGLSPLLQLSLTSVAR